MKNKYLPPVLSIRQYCLWCCNNQEAEVRYCPKTDCPFYEMRMGKKGKGVSPLKKIRERCIDCLEHTRDIPNCEFSICPIFQYRFGKNPARKGVGGAKIAKSTFPSKILS